MAHPRLVAGMLWTSHLKGDGLSSSQSSKYVFWFWKGVLVYLQTRVYCVLSRLQNHGVKAKRSKCLFMAKEVPNLGHIIDAEGLRTATSKTEAIVQALPLENTQELRSFLGMLNYYGRFVPNLSTILHP